MVNEVWSSSEKAELLGKSLMVYVTMPTKVAFVHGLRKRKFSELIRL